jgi:hypothetical protein
MPEATNVVCQLEDDIARSVHTATRGRVRRLEVELVDGRVVLRGQAATYYAKQLAQQATRAIQDDLAVLNDIVVA